MPFPITEVFSFAILGFLSRSPLRREEPRSGLTLTAQRMMGTGGGVEESLAIHWNSHRRLPAYLLAVKVSEQL